MPAFLLDLATAPAVGPVSDWLASCPLSRSIGSVYWSERADTYLEAVDPRRAYDVLGFVETTTAARRTEAGRRSYPPTRDPAPAPVNLELAGTDDVPTGWEWSERRRLHRYGSS
jgi:hypothetical protein